MLRLAVIVQPLTMIRDDGDDRGPEQAAGVQPLEKPADQLVGVRDLAVVRIGHSMARRRRIGRVRLVQMKECEDRTARVSVDPAGQRVHRDPAVALRVGERFTGSGDLNPVVEEIEPAIDAGLMAKNVCGHGTAGGVAGRLEPAGERALIRFERVANVVADTVTEGYETREQRRM